MHPKLKTLAPEIWQAIQQANNILLHLHPRPDQDSIGSVLAMGHVLAGLDKKFTVIKGDSPMPEEYSHLPGYDWIVNKNFFEIDLADFDLFLILDTGGVEQISRQGEITFPDHLNTILIDHHDNTVNFARTNLILSDYPAVGQLLFDLFKEWGVALTPEIAINLLIGIQADTGGFKYPRTTSDTLSAAAELAQIAPDFPTVIARCENTLTPGEVAYMGLGLSKAESIFNNQAAISAISYEDLRLAGINAEDVHQNGIANWFRQVKEWKIGIALVESTPGQTWISLRSQDGEKYDVSKVALAFGGGGHRAAAGATIKKPLAGAKAEILRAAEELFK